MYSANPASSLDTALLMAPFALLMVLALFRLDQRFAGRGTRNGRRTGSARLARVETDSPIPTGVLPRGPDFHEQPPAGWADQCTTRFASPVGRKVRHEIEF